MWQWRQRVDNFHGPMATIAAAFDTNRTLLFPSAAFMRFVELVGLTPLVSSPGHVYRSEDLKRLLLQHGPLMCVGTFLPDDPQAGHAVVVIGVDTDTDTVFYVDSEPPLIRKSTSIPWFNFHLYTYRPQSRPFDSVYYFDRTGRA
jgi:hypothetical protein